jgi:hypothetical protein
LGSSLAAWNRNAASIGAALSSQFRDRRRSFGDRRRPGRGWLRLVRESGYHREQSRAAAVPRASRHPSRRFLEADYFLHDPIPQ